MKSHITPNQKRQLPGQSPEEGMGASTPEARHQSPASSEDSSKTGLLHLGSGRGRREVCSIDWEEKNQVRIPSDMLPPRVPSKGKSSCCKDREMGNANMVPHGKLSPANPVEIHHIKQRDGESTEDFMERYKEEVLDVEGAPECMKISGFMHGITHPELIKRLYEKIPRSMDEMYNVTTSFLQGEVAAFSHGRKKAPTSWKSDRKPERFSLLTKTPKEIFTLEKGKFKAPPPMVTPADKRDPNKYCEFHEDTGHSTDEYMQLRKQIDEMIKASKLSQFIKELK
ncbi:hypothetical protein Tco_1108580 [Tanacetum coccineum]